MYYSLIGFLAFLLLLITNNDVLFKKRAADESSEQKIYRRFLIAVIYYYVTDVLWGVLDSMSLRVPLFIDTELYFIAMALGVLFWTQYVIAYLNDKTVLRRFLSYGGIVFFSAVTVLTVLNIFYPVIFLLDESAEYQTGPARNIILIVQILILLLTSVYALYTAFRKDHARKNRHLTIGLFGIIMLVFISIQFFEPYLPLYSIGYMLGCSLLRTFVIENEKEAYRKGLESALAREKKDLQELNDAWELAYTDPLTGAKSRLAYAVKEEEIDRAIDDGTAGALAIAVFDVNGLKKVNDTEGHDAGDDLIIRSCDLISDTFKNIPVFRVGGDEFVAVIEGPDYENRSQLMELFDRKIDENRESGGAVIAAGLAEYDPETDTRCKRIFEKADRQMYQRKNELKDSRRT